MTPHAYPLCWPDFLHSGPEMWVTSHTKEASIALIVLAVGWAVAGLSFIACAAK